MRALIIVDMQNDFMPWGSLPVFDGDSIIRTINSLMPHFEHVFATQDWHPKDHISFANNHGKEPGETIQVKGQDQALWPVHAVQDSSGAELVGSLHREKIERVFYKGTDSEMDSYSTFFDNAKQKSTGLSDYLQDQGIDELYFTGVATEYCVLYSVIDALEIGYKTYVIKDAVKGIDSEGEKHAFHQMKKKGVTILTSEELITIS